MARILVVNPNSSVACSAGISDALAPFRLPGGPSFEVATLAEGPPAIYDWRDWHGVVEPLCRMIEREPADAYVIACTAYGSSGPCVYLATTKDFRSVERIPRTAKSGSCKRAPASAEPACSIACGFHRPLCNPDLVCFQNALRTPQRPCAIALRH